MLMVGTYYFAYVGEFVYVIIGNLANNVASDTIRKEVRGGGGRMFRRNHVHMFIK